MNSCVTESDLHRLNAGETSDVEAASMRQHIAGCTSCAARNAALVAQHNERIQGLRRAGSPTDARPIQVRMIAEPTPAKGDGPRKERGPVDSTATASTQVVGAKIGDYTILRELGRGGMGVVYEAQQQHPNRPVALKVIRSDRYFDDQHVKLFQREAQALARLKHPCIGAIYESGRTDDGQHFFSMELVRGQPLMANLTQTNPTMRQRLRLFIQICEAVHYAHQQGVMHRDLKPGNILIDAEGNPKILDFGLARITDSDVTVTTVASEIGRIAGTLQYMSPEQARGNPDEIDIRSDVYSLGVILFEMLTGAVPYDLGRGVIHEAVRIICEEPPRRPSSILKTLRGDVETIVDKALEKEKSRRYQAASALAADIERYLSDQPIAARPPSAVYQLSKFARRNKAVVTGVAAVFIVLIVGVATTTAMFHRSESQRLRADAARSEAEAARAAEVRQRQTAESSLQKAEMAEQRTRAERDKAQRVADFMSQMLRGVAPSVALGRDTTMLKEMMDGAALRINRGELTAVPEAELQLRLTIGDTYRQIAEFAPAYEMLDPAIALARKHFGLAHERYAELLVARQSLLLADGKGAAALDMATTALAIQRRQLKGDHSALAESLFAQAKALLDLGRPAEALPKAEAALAMRERLNLSQYQEGAALLDELTSWCPKFGWFATPRLVQAALQELHEHFRNDSPQVAGTMGVVGACLLDLGRLNEAEIKFRETLKMTQRFYMGDNPSVASALNNLAARGESPLLTSMVC